jgi:hypothetical protein
LVVDRKAWYPLFRIEAKDSKKEKAKDTEHQLFPLRVRASLQSYRTFLHRPNPPENRNKKKKWKTASF